MKKERLNKNSSLISFSILLTSIFLMVSCNQSKKNDVRSEFEKKAGIEKSNTTDQRKELKKATKDSLNKPKNKKVDGLKYLYFEDRFGNFDNQKTSYKILIDKNNDVEIIYQYAYNTPIIEKGKLENDIVKSENWSDCIISDNKLCVSNPETDELECYKKISESQNVYDEIMTFKECSCGAHDCGLIFIDSKGIEHEFYQNIIIKQYDFKCPEGIKFKNKKFRIKYEYDANNEIENFISISLK
jgi:hypothetical protein